MSSVISGSVLSLYHEAYREALRYKWIQSEKSGRDLGHDALNEWYRLYWLTYCRFKRLEHLQGHQQWEEFEEECFGEIYSLLLEGHWLVTEILNRVVQGQENLEILNWALDSELEMDEVISILSIIDVNRARLDPPI